MINAYNDIYLDDARDNLAVIIDYSVNWLKIPLANFWNMFVLSPICQKIERGQFDVVSGKSGIEIVDDLVLNHIDLDYYSFERSREYWLGDYLAYFQWRTSASFAFINKYVKIEELLSLYNPYHEMDVEQFVDRVIEIIKSRKKNTNLEIARKYAKMSRSELSKISGVPVRTIEQYEQGYKDINKANVSYVMSMAKALNTNVSNLLEISNL